MSIQKEKTLRDRYFSNEIFSIGDLVEDTTTGQQVKIIDRGSNYVTVATTTGIVKRWLNEVKENIVVAVTESVAPEVKKPELEYEILPSGQLKIFGHETRNFDNDLCSIMMEQFEQFDDLYIKHQIIKNLDLAIQESDSTKAYDLLIKVESCYDKKSIQTPFIVEAIKTDIERKRIAEIIAAVAGTKISVSNYKTMNDAIVGLKEKYKSQTQWKVLHPFFTLADNAGLTGLLQLVPFMPHESNKEEIEEGVISRTLEEHIDLLVDDLHIDDISETFTDDSDYSDTMLSEVLTIDDRNKLSRKLSNRSVSITVKRDRALSHAATADVLMSRARKLAETMVKRRMFHKGAEELSRQEKERFEAGAPKRRALISRLAQKLVSKVRALQSARLHHSPAPASHQAHHAPQVGVGAS